MTQFADRVKDTTTTTGTGTITLANSAPAGYRTFGAAFGVGDLIAYCITAGLEFEIGVGTLASSSTLARTTVLSSSSAGALVSFSAGAKDVFCTLPAALVAGGPLAVQALSTSIPTLTLNFTPNFLETAIALTLTQNVSITIGSAPTGFEQRMVLELIQDATGGRVATFVNPTWAGAIAPTMDTTALRRNAVQFRGVGGDIAGAAFSINRVANIPALPGAPASISVTPGNAQNSVAAAAVTAYPAVTGYTVYRGLSAGGESATPIATNASLPYVDTALANGTAYFYKVAAVNSVGTGAQSLEGTGTPSVAAIPGAPASITVTPGNAQNSINASAVTASPAVTGYTVYRGLSAGAESATPIAANVALPYADTGLTNGTAYFYKVAAVNTSGTGAQSPEGSGTPVVAHYATFGSDPGSQAIFSAPVAGFNPTSSAFTLTARIRPTSFTNTYPQCIFGCWDGVTPASRLWQLALTTDGRIRASWATSSTVYPSAQSNVLGAAAGVDISVKAVVNPTAGTVNFYTSLDGITYNQVGTTVTASSSGAVYAPTTAPYLVVSGNASSGTGGTAQEAYTGKISEASLTVGATLITHPVMGPTTTVDTVGLTYGTSATGVVYS